MVVVGKKRSQGEYNGNQYDNVLLHCLQDFQGDGTDGQEAVVVKVKSCDVSYNSVSVGDDITPVYNRFGNVERIDIKHKGKAIV